MLTFSLTFLTFDPATDAIGTDQGNHGIAASFCVSFTLLVIIANIIARKDLFHFICGSNSVLMLTHSVYYRS